MTSRVALWALPLCLTFGATAAADEPTRSSFGDRTERFEVADLARPAGGEGERALRWGGSFRACYDLAIANRYNVLALGSYEGWNTDIEGKAIAGWTFEMDGFSACREDPGGVCVRAAHDLVLDNGSVYGDAGYFSSYAIGSDVDFATGGVARRTSPYIFRGLYFVTGFTSSRLSRAVVNGVTTVNPYGGGGVYLSGSDPNTTVFEVAAADLEVATYIRVEVPAGTAAVINVTGSSLTLGGLAIDLVGGSPETTLWNLPQASAVDLSAIDFQGSMLAPRADVVFHNGQFNGSLFADDITGTGQFNLALLDTDFCVRQRF